MVPQYSLQQIKVLLLHTLKNANLQELLKMSFDPEGVSSSLWARMLADIVALFLKKLNDILHE